MQPMVDYSEKVGPEHFPFRLRATLAHKGFLTDASAKRQLVKMFKVSAESARKWLSGDSFPKHERIIEIARWAQVNTEWLLTGAGGMLQASAQEVAEATNSEYVTIPFHNARASAGGGSFNDEHTEIPGGLHFRARSLAKRGLHASDLVNVFVDGDSMEPTLQDGDMVLLDRSKSRVIDGEIFGLIGPDGDIRLKRLFLMMDGRIRVSSDNPDKMTYPDETVPADSSLEIIGRFVWLARFNPKLR